MPIINTDYKPKRQVFCKNCGSRDVKWVKETQEIAGERQVKWRLVNKSGIAHRITCTAKTQRRVK